MVCDAAGAMPSSKNKPTYLQHIHSSQTHHRLAASCGNVRYDNLIQRPAPPPDDQTPAGSAFRQESGVHATDRPQRSIWRDVIQPRSFYFVLARTSPKTPSAGSAMIVYTKARRCFIVHVIYNSFGPFFFHSCSGAHSLYSKLLPKASDGFPSLPCIPSTVACS